MAIRLENELKENSFSSNGHLPATVSFKSRAQLTQADLESKVWKALDLHQRQCQLLRQAVYSSRTTPGADASPMPTGECI